MKKTTAAIALLLAISAVLYYSNTTLASRAAVPSQLSPTSQTSTMSGTLSFRVDNFGGASQVDIFVRPDAGSYGSVPSFTLTQEGVTVTKKVSDISQITGTGTYEWKGHNNDGFSSEEPTITIQ